MGKKYLGFGFVLGLLQSACLIMLHAQDSASVAWDLAANMALSRKAGAVSGSQELFSYSASDSSLNLQVRDYSAPGGGQRLNLGQKTWPYETSENRGRYVQFAVTPNPGRVLHITAVGLDIGGGGTSAMGATVYWALDSNFQFRSILLAVGNLPNGAWLNPAPRYSLNIEVGSTQTFYVRVSPFYESTNASTSKYLYLRGVVISGITTPRDTAVLPAVTTTAISIITSNSAASGGTVLWDGGLPVTSRGVCWNTPGSPTIVDNTTSDGSGTGGYLSRLTGLTEGATYFVRAYATNAIGTGYGVDRTFVARSAVPAPLAFPRAEGFGKNTVGGRGGAVYEVTTLDDSGPGSLRAAIDASGPRTVVFRLSGTIVLNSDLVIRNPYITIAGQTAPGDGICLRKYPLIVAANQAIIRYIRVRLGDESGGESDAMSARWQNNIIVDHCSASWSQDETLSFYWCDSLTIQWCIISESLYNSHHPKGAHGYGGIWGGSNSTYHHNLLAHHSSRNPRFASGSGNTDFRNNVIFNWGFNSAYGGEAHDSTWSSPLSTINVVANYYQPGPATKANVQYRIVNPSTRNGLADYGLWHVTGNYVQGYPDATGDNWTYGVQGPSESDKAAIRSDVPFPFSPIAQETPGDAWHSIVLLNAGANYHGYDSVDNRVRNDVATGTARYEGASYRVVQGFPASAPTTGIIDSQNDVGGWPVLNSLPAPLDTDHDGMPDEWEITHGLNVSDPADRNFVGEDGYTNLEKYLNREGVPVSVSPGGSKPESMMLYPCYPNPFNPSTTIGYAVAGTGHEARGNSWVRLAVYDMLGREVAVLVNERKNPGSYSVAWDAKGVSSGVYFSMLDSDGKRLAEKMVLMK